MKRIVVLGDVHGHLERLEACLDVVASPRPDLALLVGDVALDPMTRRNRGGHDASVRAVLRRTESKLGCPVVFVPGNHDLTDPPADAAGTNIDGQVTRVADLDLAGFGGAGPALFDFPYEWTDEQAQGKLSRLFGHAPPPPDVFLCHAPPFGTRIDRLKRGVPVGSRALSEWIARLRPRLFVCGHIHEAFGLDWVDDTPCLNAGALGEPYGQEIVWTVDWEDGPRRIECFRRGDGDWEQETLNPLPPRARARPGGGDAAS